MADLSSSPNKGGSLTPSQLPLPPPPPSSSSDVSANTSRPTSPAEEAAEESLTPTEEDEYKKMAVAQCRRKSSVWKKTLNLKKQISKVNMKISTTIGEGVRRGSVFFGPTDGQALSPVEVSPPEFPPSQTAIGGNTDRDRDTVDREIAQSMADAELSERTNEQSDDLSAENSDSDNEQRPSSDTEWKKRIMNQPQYFQTRRSDASEEMAARMLEGTRAPRPSDLSLFDENGRPVPMPRSKPRESRNQRLLSVPNIKYQRKESVLQKQPGDVAKPTKPRHASSSSSSASASTSFAGNLMRRFSKYQLRDSYTLSVSTRIRTIHVS